MNSALIMPLKQIPHNHRSSGPASSQRGVVLVVTLIALVIMMIGAVALVRSFNTSLIAAGQLSFKRDLMNRGEVGLAAAKKALTSGALNTDILRQNNLLSANYFATLRSNNDNAQGVPKDLIKDTDFTGTLSDTQVDGVSIRYIIERQCTTAGPFSPTTCSVFPKPAATSGGERKELVGAEYSPVYRITVRVQGPRNTTTYLQGLVSI